MRTGTTDLQPADARFPGNLLRLRSRDAEQNCAEGYKEHRGTAVAYIADLVGDPRPLLRPSLQAVPAGVRALIAVPAPEQRGTYARAGFFPTRTTLHFMGKALAGELQTDLRAWRFTLGDTDFF